MPDWNNHLCAECSFRSGDDPLPGGDEPTLACENCPLSFPPIVANDANYALLVETDRSGEDDDDGQG